MRKSWNSTSSDWSGETTNLGTIGSVDNGGGGYNLKWQLVTNPVIDIENDRLYIGWARWKDNTAGDTVSIAYLDSSDTASSPIDIYSANGTHSYAPTIGISFDNTGHLLYIGYVESTTNGDNGSVDYKTYDGTTLSDATRFYTSPGGSDGEDGGADLPVMTQDRIASNDRIYIASGLMVHYHQPKKTLTPFV